MDFEEQSSSHAELLEGFERRKRVSNDGVPQTKVAAPFMMSRCISIVLAACISIYFLLFIAPLMHSY